jgi:acid phosphatase
MPDARIAAAPAFSGMGRAVLVKRLCAAAGILMLALLANASAWAQDASGCQGLPENPKVDRTWPANRQLLPDQLVIYRCRYYLAEMAGALWDARTWVKRRAPQVAKPAVVFDIDETSLSNWEAMYHNHFAYVASGPCDLGAPAPCGQHDWDLSARAVALAPTLELYRFLKTLKDKDGRDIAVFFVTGRTEDASERSATEMNLRKEGYDTWQKLYLRPESNPGKNVSVYKTDSRRDIEKDHVIIANIGDQYSDLIGDAQGDHAERCFKLPNPFYFIGPPLPDAGLKCMSR